MSNVVSITRKAAPAPRTRSASNAVNITDAQVKRWLRDIADGGVTGRVEYRDTSNSKLCARVSKGGVCFSAALWNPATGSTARVHLGKVTDARSPEYSMATIRKAAGRAIVEVRDGT